MQDTQAHYWKSKLAAYLHDPPSKCVDIRLHKEQAKTLYRQAGFQDEAEQNTLAEEYAAHSDWTASAADRFPFPSKQITSQFDGIKNGFHHPLSGNNPLRFHAEFSSVAAASEVDQELQPVVSSHGDVNAWQANYFSHWRLWEKFCVEKDYRFAFLPAETRLPDHSVWTHMQVVSALQSCSEGTGKFAKLRPAFLKFQIGPVQEFIAEARSIRDLWSGSYLLSWLMAAGLKALALKIGPDAVVFPNLKGQPIFDLQLRDFYSEIQVNGKSIWEHVQSDAKNESEHKKNLLTPNLPNVFLAIVHQDRAQELGKLVEDAMRAEWKNIAGAVWSYCAKAGMIQDEGEFTAKDREERFYRQIEQHLSISWVATPWPASLDDALQLASAFPSEKMPINVAKERVEAIKKFSESIMPQEHRDKRYYSDTAKTKLNNVGLAWSVILAYNSWQLDAVRQTRHFPAWATDGAIRKGTLQNKDSLGGKAEAVAGGKVWHERATEKGEEWATLFKHEDWLGAATLVKRLWHLAYLKANFAFDEADFKMPNTHGIASYQPYSDGDVKELPEDKYYAVLALDGDEIGKWVSGEKTPVLGEQFSDYEDSSKVQRYGAKVYFENNQGEELLKTNRPLAPAYHLQFSQALSNFALLCARPIVEAHDGRLIYAGGDDVLALLPAGNALACAAELRRAFQGTTLPSDVIQTAQQGYLTLRKDQSELKIPFVVPGPAAEVSVGIAMAHVKAPLQDVVKAAQIAEKRAKGKDLGRAAVAMSILKRSGEITEWGSRWQSGGLELYQCIYDFMNEEKLSAKFAHRVCQLLTPYIGNGQHDVLTPQQLKDIILAEFAFAITRQKTQRLTRENQEALTNHMTRYLQHLIDPGSCSSQQILSSVDSLCTAVAFAARTKNKSR